MRAFGHNIARYLDDLLVGGCPQFEQYLYRFQDDRGWIGLYPQEFLTVARQEYGRSVTYMDLRIYIDFSFAFHTTIYHKLDDAKFSKLHDHFHSELGVLGLRYPHVSSALHVSSKYGLITEELHRFARRCSKKTSFIYHSAKLLSNLLRKGYKRPLVIAKAFRFLRKHTPLYNTINAKVIQSALKKKVEELLRG